MAYSRSSKTMAYVLADGSGERLFPLTLHRAKPAVPFGGQVRIIDFLLGNLFNSDIHLIVVATQYLNQSLHRQFDDGRANNFGQPGLRVQVPTEFGKALNYATRAGLSVHRHQSVVTHKSGRELLPIPY